MSSLNILANREEARDFLNGFVDVQHLVSVLNHLVRLPPTDYNLKLANEILLLFEKLSLSQDIRFLKWSLKLQLIPLLAECADADLCPLSICNIIANLTESRTDLVDVF